MGTYVLLGMGKGEKKIFESNLIEIDDKSLRFL